MTLELIEQLIIEQQDIGELLNADETKLAQLIYPYLYPDKEYTDKFVIDFIHKFYNTQIQIGNQNLFL